MDSLQRLHTRDSVIHGEVAELERLRQEHKEKCSKKACKRCATFRRQLDSLTKEKAFLAELLRSYE